MNSLAKFFIDNHKLTIVLSIGLVVFGLQGLRTMNSESYPAVSFAMATVTTSYEGATAEDIETKITKPLEDEIRTVSGLKDVRSTSQSGLSTIFIRADIDNVDVDKVMSDLQKAIDRTTDLPPDLREQPKFEEIKSEEFPVIEIAVTGSNENRQRDKIADLLKEEIEDNKKVKGVRLVGFARRRFQIRLDQKAMLRHHIGVNEVLAKIGARNQNIPGGSLKTSANQKLVRIEGKINGKQELENILVRSNFSGERIFLKDIAIVEDTEEEIPVKARFNGEEATALIVSKKGGADTISLVKDLDSKLAQFNELYKNKVKFHIYNNESTKVKNRLDVLSSNALSGLLLVVLFLFIFLPGRIGLMASLSLPLAVMGTMGVMPAFDMNLDAITILALVIALGMMVDNSVVITENYTRLRREGRDAADAAKESVRQLWLPITATAFTTIAAFLPMLVTKGIMGQFIKYIPIVVTISLILSLGESFFFLPMRLVHFGGRVKQVISGQGADWFSRFESGFEKMMTILVRRRWFVTIGFSAIVFTSLFMIVGMNKFILFPAEETEIYVARLSMEKGTRVELTSRVLEKVGKEVKNVLGEDVKNILGRAGVSQTQPTDPKAKSGNNVGMLTIYVSDHAKYNIPHTEILNKLRTISVKEAESLTFEAMVNGPPVGNAIEASFRSNSFEDIDSLIAKMKIQLEKVPGIVDLKVNDVVGDDEVFIEIDHVKADSLGLTVESIGNSVRAAVSGKIISNVTLDNKEIDLMVRFQEPFRTKVEDLNKITIMDSRGNLVPLGDLATFRVSPGSPQVKRYDFKRSKTLTGDVDESVITAQKANQIVQKLYEENAADYPSVSMIFGGVAESTKESMESLFNALVISLIGIFALLVFLFKSYLRPAIIMTTIPLGLFGFSIAFYLHGRPTSFMSLIGIIGLGGIIVNSGIVLISFIDQMREEGKLSLEEILVKASGMRLRAVLVTSLTTISGLLPTAYGIGGRDAMLIPMTLAMAWGLTSGTLLTLIWVPCAYALLEDFNGLIAKITGKKENKTSSETVSEAVSS